MLPSETSWRSGAKEAETRLAKIGIAREKNT